MTLPAANWVAAPPVLCVSSSTPPRYDTTPPNGSGVWSTAERYNEAKPSTILDHHVSNLILPRATSSAVMVRRRRIRT